MENDWIALVETVSNQPFIFGSNRLAENVGASELIHRAGTVVARQAIGLLTENQPAAVLPVLLTSGRVLVACSTSKVAEQFVTLLSTRWLQEVPGIGMAAAVTDGFDQTPHAAVAEVHRLAAANTVLPIARFPRLPIIEGCSSTPNPAAALATLGPGTEPVPVSTVAAAKRKKTEAGIDRFANLLGKNSGVCKNLGELEALGLEDKWVGVVHIDGNGLGKVFLDFGRDPVTGAECYDGPGYATALTAFSAAIDTVTVAAAQAALTKVEPGAPKGTAGRSIWPLVPLVLGGDDVTLVCDGRVAIPFTEAFLEAFETEADANQTVKKHLAGTRLTACGGVAIVKAHFPFHAAYDLAAELLTSAKQVKARVLTVPVPAGAAPTSVPCSALDFHVLRDTTFSSRRQILARSATDGGQVSLTAGPYVVTQPAASPPLSTDATDWLVAHRLAPLKARASAVNAAGKRVSHDLRTAVSASKQEGEASLKRATDRAESLANVDRLNALKAMDPLYLPADARAGNGGATWLIDALDYARFGQP